MGRSPDVAPQPTELGASVNIAPDDPDGTARAKSFRPLLRGFHAKQAFGPRCDIPRAVDPVTSASKTNLFEIPRGYPPGYPAAHYARICEIHQAQAAVGIPRREPFEAPYGATSGPQVPHS